MRPRRNRRGNIRIRSVLFLLTVASMRPRRNRRGNASVTAYEAAQKKGFNEAAAESPRKCGDQGLRTDTRMLQ